MPNAKRDQLIDTALELFYQEGFHAVGIDRILAQAGVAKKTLYNHFRSKDELILAALNRRDEEFRAWFLKFVEDRASTPKGQLLAAFDALDEWFHWKKFSGCLFINATAEYPGDNDPIHLAAVEHKHLIVDQLRQLAQAAGASDPQDLAEQLMILLDGATAARYTAGRPDAAKLAKRMAEILISRAAAQKP